MSSERREEILADLKAYFATVDTRRESISAAEADDIINEALRSTRPDYQPAK